MAATRSQQDQGRNGWPAPRLTSWSDVTVIAVLVAGIGWVSAAAMSAYEAGEAAAVLAAVIGPLAGIGAAAFGVRLSAQAREETRNVKQQTGQVASMIDSVLPDLIAGAAGASTRANQIAPGGSGVGPSELQLALTQIVAARERLSRLAL
ncbi:MAG: hypothetical protein M3198_10835 [Actinomycetota bacterium]|nr:hypothetical protein [Actinomycetota bacterium]